MNWLEFLEQDFYNNTVWEWGVAFTVTLVVFIGFLFVKKKGLEKIRHLILRDRTGWSSSFLDALQNTKILVLLLLAVYIGVRSLTLPDVIESNLRVVAFSAFFIQIGLWCAGVLNAWSTRYRERQLKVNPASVTSLGAIRILFQGVIWSAILLLILDNAGFDVTALVAGLGIGGVAVALAVQNILGDLFSSLSIVMDKTFAVGDFIIVGEYLGTVENIGLKTTRIRSLSGEQIVFSNSDLLGGRIRNYGRMYERRVPIKIGVTYQTPREKLKKIPSIIKDAIEIQENTRFDRAHFQAYGEYSLDFEYVYYVLTPDYNEYMDINQAINFYLHEKFEKEGIEFAYPTRTMFVQNLDEPHELQKEKAA